jgi:NIMA (never in mitosis gene a)-related kinase
MSLNDFEFLKELGKGAFGTVFTAKRKADNQIYAMKRVNISKMTIRDRENALNEIRVLASICHPNIVDYKEAFYDEESSTLNIVMEYVDEGDLGNKIINFKNLKTFIPENEVWSIMIQAVSGLKALHDKKIMHRDLKSANIFMSKKGEVKLGDLNVSKVVKMGFLYTQTGTPYYASPEVWSEKPYEYKSDIWSLGCVIYEICALKPPFRAQSLEILYKTVLKGVYEPIPSVYSKELQTLLGTLLHVDPKKRPSCETILSYPIVKKKIEMGNLSLSVCQGALLNTIKWTVNSFEINQKLNVLKRYSFKLNHPRHEKNLSVNFNNTIVKDDKVVCKINNKSSNTFKSSSKEIFCKKESEKLNTDNNSNNLNKSSFKSPMIIRKYINIAENEKENKKAILDIVQRSCDGKKIQGHSVTPLKKENVALKSRIPDNSKLKSKSPLHKLPRDSNNALYAHQSKKNNVNYYIPSNAGGSITSHNSKTKHKTLTKESTYLININNVNNMQLNKKII